MTNCGVAWLSGNKDLTFMVVQPEDCHILLLFLQIKSHKKAHDLNVYNLLSHKRDSTFSHTNNNFWFVFLFFCFFFYHFFPLNVDETV